MERETTESQANGESSASESAQIVSIPFRSAEKTLSDGESGESDALKRRRDDDSNDESEGAPNVLAFASGAKNDAESFDAAEEIDPFFAKSFAVGSESNASDAAFAGGLRSIFEAEADLDDELDESDAERFQRETEEERREAIDAENAQNDADFLYDAGAKYERPRLDDSVFDGRSSASTRCESRENRAAKRDGDGEREFEPFDVDDSERRAAIRPSSILEAALFVGDRENRPLTLARATELMRDVSETEALEALADLNERYFRDGAPYRIVRDGDGFRMTLRPEFERIAARFGGKTKEFKLSQTAIDALAIVAYKQPITLDEILEIREAAAGALAQLVKRDLISLEKRVVERKKVAYYQTTPRFLTLFGLESLDDLPIVGDVDYR